MKTATASIALAVAALLAGHAQAADTSKTREQVRAELAEAQRTGDIVANTDVGSSEFVSGKGQKLSTAFPESYAQASTGGKTREQVRAELTEAQRTGSIVANSDVGSSEFVSGKGQTLSAAFPESYAQASAGGKTRAQVRAELAEAQRTGDIVASRDVGNSEFVSGAGRKLNELFPNNYPLIRNN
jgi:hypothetical protein